MVPLRLVAYQEIHLKGPKPEGYAYPHPISYQVFYVATATGLDDFVEEEDMVERRWMTAEEAHEIVRWVKRTPELFERLRGI